MYRQPVSSHSYCSLTSSGRVDWVNVTTSLATLSLKHPQLLGYRIDDFSEFLRAPATRFWRTSDILLNSPQCPG